MGSRKGLEGCEKSRPYQDSNPEPISQAFIPCKSYDRSRFLNMHTKEEKDTNGCVTYYVHIGVI